MKQKITTALGLVLIGVLATAAFFMTRGLYRWFGSIEKDKAVAAIAIANLALLPVATYVANRALERRKSIESATRAKRVEIYEEVMSYMLSMMLTGKDASGHTPEEYLDFFRSITPRLIAHGSNDVIQQWGKIRSLASESNPMETWENLVKAMRKDLGHSSFGLQRNDLLRVFVNDLPA